MNASENKVMQDIADNIMEIVQHCYGMQDIDHTIESVQKYLEALDLTTVQKQEVFAKYWQHAQNDDWATLKEIKAIAQVLEYQITITAQRKK